MTSALSNGVSVAPVSMTAIESRIVIPIVEAMIVVVAPTAVRTSVLSQTVSIVARSAGSGTCTR
jgi:hypothetical protein